MRQCAGCGRRRGKHELVRLVADDDSVALDATGARPGRGVYLCPDAACAAAARRKRTLPRRLRAPVRVPDDLERRLAEAAGGRS